MKKLLSLLVMVVTLVPLHASDEQLIYDTMTNMNGIERTMSKIGHSIAVINEVPLDVNVFKQHVKSLKMNVNELDKLEPILNTSRSKVVKKLYQKHFDGNDMMELKDFVSKLEALSESMQIYEYSVYANEGYRPTNIKVNQGDFLFVYSDGTWSTSDRLGSFGMKGSECYTNTAYNIVKETPHGALIVRVRGSRNQAGTGLQNNRFFIADANGSLEFTTNDNDQRNNSGMLNLKIMKMNGNAFSQLMEVIASKSKKTNDV